MPVLYKTIQSTKENKEGVKLFHPRAVHVATISSVQLAKEIAEYSSLTTGDVKNTIDNLVTVMTKHLHASESVTLDGLGTFSLVMRSRGRGAATAGEVSPSQARLHIRFIPDFTKKQDGTVDNRALITGVNCVPYSKESAASGGGNTGGTGGGEDPGDNPLG